MSNPTDAPRAAWTRWWPQRLLFLAAFTAAGYLGRLTIIDGGSVSLVWPAAGIAALWFLLGRARLLGPDVLLLAVVSLVVNTTTGASFQLGTVFIVANVAQALTVASLMRRWSPHLWGADGNGSLDSSREVGRFASAAAVGALVGATIGTLGLWWVTGGVSPVASAVWFGRNLCGILALTGLGLVVGQRYAETRSWRRVFDLEEGRATELFAVVSISAAVSIGVFTVDELPLEFPLLVSTVWVGLRFSTAISIAHSWAVGLFAVVLTLRGIGPFAAVESAELQALTAQLFVGMMLVTGLVLATGRDERVALTTSIAEAERDSREQAELLRTIIRSMDEALVVVDSTGAILLQNPAVHTVAGGDVRSVGDLMCCLPDGSPMPDPERPYARALAGDPVRAADVTVAGASGELRTLCVSAQPLQSRPGQPRRAVMVFRDVTDERQQQRELAAFAGVVAHDLLNPVTSVAGWAEVLEAELGDGDDLAHDAVRRVSRGVERMRQLISDLLTHARSKDGPLDLADLDLAALVEDVALARDTPYVTVDPDLAGVRADESLLRQVLDNLIGNGLKYVAPGTEPWVSVHATRDRRDRGMVRVSVVDNGIGIPDEQRQQVFDEFHRAHADDYEGTGLGLAICRRIVERHGGSIGIESNHPSPGSTFWFTVPAAHRPVGRSGSPATAARERA